MPHWLVLLGIVVTAWLAVAVVGGWAIGRGLDAIERRTDGAEPSETGRDTPPDLRQAA